MFTSALLLLLLSDLGETFPWSMHLSVHPDKMLELGNYKRVDGNKTLETSYVQDWALSSLVHSSWDYIGSILLDRQIHFLPFFFFFILWGTTGAMLQSDFVRKDSEEAGVKCWVIPILLVLARIGHNVGDGFYWINFHVYVCGQNTIRYNRK